MNDLLVFIVWFGMNHPSLVGVYAHVVVMLSKVKPGGMILCILTLYAVFSPKLRMVTLNFTVSFAWNSSPIGTMVMFKSHVGVASHGYNEIVALLSVMFGSNWSEYVLALKSIGSVVSIRNDISIKTDSPIAICGILTVLVLLSQYISADVDIQSSGMYIGTSMFVASSGP